jgi:hypothetical protein
MYRFQSSIIFMDAHLSFDNPHEELFEPIVFNWNELLGKIAAFLPFSGGNRERLHGVPDFPIVPPWQVSRPFKTALAARRHEEQQGKANSAAVLEFDLEHYLADVVFDVAISPRHVPFPEIFHGYTSR